MFRMYPQIAALAFRRSWKAWPVAFSLLLYATIVYGALFLSAPLGILGGFLVSFVLAGCASGYIHLLAEAVKGSKLHREDLTRGFKLRFWDVVGVLFAFWILSFVVQFAQQGAGPNAASLGAVVGLAMAFFFNTVPEQLYLGGARSFGLLAESARFVMANPVAWLLPNVLLATIFVAPTGLLTVSRPAEWLLLFSTVFSPSGLASTMALIPSWAALPLLVFLHYAMVFRGLLFQELSSGNSRMRAFRARMGGSS